MAGGFGKGYNYLTARLTVTMSKFDALIAAGINVVLLAHSSIVRFDPPDGAGAFDRYELKLYKDRKGGKGTASLIKEWADMVIFGNYRTQISEKGKGDNVKYKGVGGKERIMYCNRCAAWDAKNRHGMADVEKWDIATIEKAFLAVGAPWGGTNLKPGGEPSQNEETPRAAQPPASTPADEIPMDHEGDARRIEDEKEIEELGRVVAEHTELINEYLRKNNRIKLNDDWRGVGADYRSRILKNPAGFLKVATNGKAVTA